MKYRVFAVMALLAFLAGHSFAAEKEADDKKENSSKAEEAADGNGVQEIVVTATRTEKSLREVGQSITVIDSENMAEHQDMTIYDSLSRVPGISIRRTGGVGSQTSIHIRGSESKHVLILVDGVEANDGSNPNRTPQIDHIMLNNVERIEVLRGSQSTLYGSDAIGGVINIITKKGKAEQMHGSISLEGGSYDTVKGQGNFTYGTEKVQMALGVTKLTSGGISAAQKSDGNDEEDAYENLSLSANVSITPIRPLTINLIARHTSSEIELDDTEFVGGKSVFVDDKNSETDYSNTYLIGETVLRLFDERWTQKLGLGFTQLDRDSLNETDDASVSTRPELDSRFKSELVKLYWQHDVKLHRTNTLTLGAESELERYFNVTRDNQNAFPAGHTREEHEVMTQALFVQDQISLFNRWFTTAGVRRTNHDKFGNHDTWSVSTALLIDEIGTKLHGSYATGFKAPSLYNMFGTASWDNFDGKNGNAELKPEESKSWELGFDQSIFKGRFTFGATYFHSKVKNMIVYKSRTLPLFVFDDYYDNEGSVTSRGVESYFSFRIIKNLELQGNYVYTKAENDKTSRDLIYRPRRTASLDFIYRFLGDRAMVNIGMNYVGKRYEDEKNAKLVDDYTVFDIGGSYRFHPNWRAYARVENVFDQEYEEMRGYGVPGLSGYLGVEASF